jgi:hypothetical protein
VKLIDEPASPDSAIFVYIDVFCPVVVLGFSISSTRENELLLVIDDLLSSTATIISPLFVTNGIVVLIVLVVAQLYTSATELTYSIFCEPIVLVGVGVDTTAVLVGVGVETAGVAVEKIGNVGSGVLVGVAVGVSVGVGVGVLVGALVAVGVKSKSEGGPLLNTV